MRNYRRILRSLETQALRHYVEVMRDYVEVIEADRSEAEIAAMP